MGALTQNATTFPAPGAQRPASLLSESACSPCSTKLDCRLDCLFRVNVLNFKGKLRVDVYRKCGFSLHTAVLFPLNLHNRIASRHQTMLCSVYVSAVMFLRF